MRQKRIFSLLLALALIIGLIMVPGSDAEAAAKTKKLVMTKSLTLNVGVSKQLTLKADGKSVAKKAKWSTSSKKIVTVKKGKVTAKAPGVATVSAKFGGKTAKVKITVVGLSSTSLTMNAGQTKKINMMSGKKAVTKGVTWSSSNASVVAVSNGSLTAKAAGKATITAKYKKKAFKCTVTVKSNGGGKDPKDPTDPKKPTEKKIEIKVEEGSTSLNPAGYAVLSLTEGGEVIKSGVTWTAVNTSSTPKGPASVGEIQVVHVRTSTKMDDRGKAYIIGEYGGTAKVTATYNGKTYTKDFSVSQGFDGTKDITIKEGITYIYIEFNLKKVNGKYDPAEIAELREMGCTVDEESGIVTKNQRCETASYTFAKFPKTVEEIKTMFINPETNGDSDQTEADTDPNYGGFAAMAANVCATNAYTWPADPAKPFYENCPQGWEIREMYEFINGPYEEDDIAEVQVRTGIQSMKDVYQQMGENGYKVYFKGATSKNNYTPSENTITMYKGPYFINEKETITGTRPTTYMIFIPGYETTATALKDVACEGYASDRYIDVWYSSTDKRWYSFQNQFLHITANNHKKPSKPR